MSNFLNYQKHGNHSIDFESWVFVPDTNKFTDGINLTKFFTLRNRIIKQLDDPNQSRKLVVKIDNLINSRKSSDGQDAGARIAIDKVYGLINNESDELRIEKIQSELKELRRQLNNKLKSK
jgi:hypothetical protein